MQRIERARAVERMKQIASSLQSQVEFVERRSVLFQKACDEIYERIRIAPLHLLPIYIKKWFARFCAMKDECLVLINGKMVRIFHRQFHKQFFHNRGQESKYFDGANELSSCSVDGLDFEFRRQSMRFNDDERFAVFADVSSTMQTRLEAVIDAINATIAGLEREVKQRGARTVTVHVRVQEETLQVHFPVGSAAKSIVLNRGSMKNLSPDTLFSTTVKDIPEVEELINKIQLRGSSSSCSSSQAQGGANQSEGAAWAVAGSVRELAKSKKRRIVVDSDDEEAYQEELQRQRAAKQQQQRAEELARLKEATDFHSEVSIDAVKRAYGASAELLATAVPNAQGAGGSSSSGGSGGSGSGVGSSSGAIGVDNDDAQREEEFDFANDPIADSAESPHRQLLGRLPLNESCTGIATPEVKTIRVRVYSPAVSDPASIKTKHKHSIPELGMQLVFERAAGGDVQCVTATVQLLNPASWCCYAPPMKDAYKRVPSVAVADILDEVRDQLWLATALSRSVEALEALEAMKLIMLWWPIAIRIGDVLYSRDDFVPFADIDAKKKTIKPILCDRTPVLMQSIGAITRWLNLQHLQSEEEVRIVVTLLWEHSSLLRVLIDQWVAQWGAGMGAEQRPVHLDLHLTTACEGSVLSLFIASVYSAVYAANQTLHLSLRWFEEHCMDPPLALCIQTCTELDLSGSDLSCNQLFADCVQELSQLLSAKAEAAAVAGAVGGKSHSHLINAGDEEVQRVFLTLQWFREVAWTRVNDCSGSGDGGGAAVVPLSPLQHLDLRQSLLTIDFDFDASCDSFNDCNPLELNEHDFNGSVAALREHCKNVSWGAFLEHAMGVWCPALQSVDVSYCARSRSEALALCAVLLRACARRVASGLLPLRVLIVNGLQLDYPDLADLLRQALAEDELDMQHAAESFPQSIDGVPQKKIGGTRVVKV